MPMWGRFQAAALLALLALATTHPSSARAATELQPGLWKITTKIERGGVTKPGPTQTRCLTPDRVKATLAASAATSRQPGACKVTEVRKHI